MLSLSNINTITIINITVIVVNVLLRNETLKFSCFLSRIAHSTVQNLMLKPSILSTDPSMCARAWAFGKFSQVLTSGAPSTAFNTAFLSARLRIVIAIEHSMLPSTLYCDGRVFVPWELPNETPLLEVKLNRAFIWALIQGYALY